MNIEKSVFNKLNKVELESQKVEFKLDPVSESKDIDSLFEKATSLRYAAFTEAMSKVNSAIKEIVGKRSALYRDMQDFSSSYEKLIGQSADNTEQVKAYKKALDRADIQIKDLTDSVGELNRVR